MAENDDFETPSDYVTVDTITADKERCQKEGSKKNETWSQQPEIVSTQLQCIKKYPPVAPEVCEKNFETNKKRALKLGLNIENKNARDICKMINIEEQRRCLYENHKCPQGTLPDWPKNPTCCQPIQKPKTAKAKVRAAITAINAVSKLKNLSKVYPDVMTIEQQKQFLETSTLSKDDQEKLLAESKVWQTRAQTFDQTMPNLSGAEQDYIRTIVKHLEQELLQTLKASQVEATKVQTSWAKTIATFFANTAKKAFDLITWIMSHPIMAMWITQLALRLKRKFCREVSLALGYGGEKVEVGTFGFLASRAKQLYDDNWQSVILTTMYRFADGVGFNAVTSVVKDGMSWAINSICLSLLAVPGFGWAAAGGVKLFSFIISSGIESAFRESLREALLMATTGLLIQKTGENVAEVLFGKCFAKQPVEYTWSFWLWSPGSETELREQEKKVQEFNEDLTTNGYLGGLGDDTAQQKAEETAATAPNAGGFFRGVLDSITGV